MVEPLSRIMVYGLQDSKLIHGLIYYFQFYELDPKCAMDNSNVLWAAQRSRNDKSQRILNQLSAGPCLFLLGRPPGRALRYGTIP